MALKPSQLPSSTRISQVPSTSSTSVILIKYIIKRHYPSTYLPSNQVVLEKYLQLEEVRQVQFLYFNTLLQVVFTYGYS